MVREKVNYSDPLKKKITIKDRIATDRKHF